jgi:hypothetical protein
MDDEDLVSTGTKKQWKRGEKTSPLRRATIVEQEEEMTTTPVATTQQLPTTKERGSETQRLSVRQLFEEQHQPALDSARIHSVIDPQRVPFLPTATSVTMTYDIFACPEQPPLAYPVEWNALTVLDHWKIDDTELPTDFIYQGLCVFDWENTQDRVTMQTYRAAELPFVLRNHDQVMQTAERWSTPGYLQDLLGHAAQRNEHSTSNHFMFWRTTTTTTNTNSAAAKPWRPPTEYVTLSYAEWLQKAQELEEQTKTSQEDQSKHEHWYFRLNGAQSQNLNTFLYQELPFFQAQDEPTLFMVDPDGERGINCRFGMKGVFAEAHYDPTRNWIVLLSGRKRYLLAHPRECSNLNVRWCCRSRK